MTLPVPRPITLAEGDIKLESGQEYYSPAISLRARDRLTVSATSQGGRFYLGFLRETDYISGFSRGSPRWYLPFVRWSARRKTYKVESTEVHRILLRVGNSQPQAVVHLTATLVQAADKSIIGAGPAVIQHVDLTAGTWAGPFNAWDAVESLVLWLFIAIGLLVLVLVNIQVAVTTPLGAKAGASPLTALFQADAEWGTFLVAIYVAAKALPEIFARRRAPKQ